MSFTDLIKSTAKENGPAAARRSFLPAPRQQPVIGLAPQVSLLPPELRDASRRRAIRRALVVGVGAVAVVVAGAVGLADVAAADSAQQLAVQTSRASALSAQLSKFDDIIALQQQIAVGEAAVRVGSSTQIDQRRWILAVEGAMPASFQVTSVTTDGATPILDYPQGLSLLDVPRAATVTITAQTASIDELPTWLLKLRDLPAYADASPAVTKGDTEYTVVLTVHLTTKAYITPLTSRSTK